MSFFSKPVSIGQEQMATAYSCHCDKAPCTHHDICMPQQLPWFCSPVDTEMPGQYQLVHILHNGQTNHGPGNKQTTNLVLPPKKNIKTGTLYHLSSLRIPLTSQLPQEFWFQELQQTPGSACLLLLPGCAGGSEISHCDSAKQEFLCTTHSG